MPEPVAIEEQVIIGDNRHGYAFAVGRVGDRWLGYAITRLGLFLFPGVSEGVDLGMEDRDEAIRRVGAIAQDLNSGYGGVETWHVPEELRGDPGRYRCDVCGEICCEDDHDLDDLDEEP
jgi:hypothetical protein